MKSFYFKTFILFLISISLLFGKVDISEASPKANKAVRLFMIVIIFSSIIINGLQNFFQESPKNQKEDYYSSLP